MSPNSPSLAPSPTPSTAPSNTRRAALSETSLRGHLQRYLRRRLPAVEAEDVLQSVLCAALEARHLPDDPEELRRFLTVVARRKVASYYRAASREAVSAELELEIEARPAPVVEASLVRWAEKQAAESSFARVDETLEWMAREGEGEKLEHIAEEARVPATAVRQRVSRLRRFMKERWALELAMALLAVAIVAGWILSRRTAPAERRFALPPPPSILAPRAPIAPPPEPTSLPAIEPKLPMGPPLPPPRPPTAPRTPTTAMSPMTPGPLPTMTGKGTGTGTAP